MPQRLLARVEEEDLRELCRTMWNWSFCHGCSSGAVCDKTGCPWNQSRQLQHFFDFYKSTVQAYALSVQDTRQPVLATHQNLFEVISLIKSNSDLRRHELAQNYATSRSPKKDLAECDRAINIATSIFLMVQCGQRHRDLGQIEQGYARASWRTNDSLVDFFEESFPAVKSTHVNANEHHLKWRMKHSLKAVKLKKLAHINFKPTEDLGRHLLLDENTGEVEIFHHTAFLKEHLIITKEDFENQSLSDTLKRGALPRQLVIETLDSIQKLLFPLNDHESKKLLQSLVSSKGFDPDCLQFQSSSLRRADEKDVTYVYWAQRLADLYAEVENPTPRNQIDRWLERKSGARYIMLATLIGVVFAVMLGFASLCLSGYQAWISYQAWQYPVSTSNVTPK